MCHKKKKKQLKRNNNKTKSCVKTDIVKLIVLQAVSSWEICVQATIIILLFNTWIHIIISVDYICNISFLCKSVPDVRSQGSDGC